MENADFWCQRASFLARKSQCWHTHCFHIFSCDLRSRSILSQFVICVQRTNSGRMIQRHNLCVKVPSQETTVGHTAYYAFKKYNEAQFGADNGVTSHQARWCDIVQLRPLKMGRGEWRRHARHVFGCEYLVSNWFVSHCCCSSCCCRHRHVAAVILSCSCLLLYSNSNTVDVMLLSFCCFHVDVILLLPWCWWLPYCCWYSAVTILSATVILFAFAMLQLPCLSFCCFHTVVIDVMLSCVMLMAFFSWPCCD